MFENVVTNHSHSLRVEHLVWGQGGEIGQVGQNIHCSHNGQRYDDGTREVSEESRQTYLLFYYLNHRIQAQMINYTLQTKLYLIHKSTHHLYTINTHLYGSIISSVTKFK